MCGILCLISNNDQADSKTIQNEFKNFESFISRRGPDSLQTELITSESYNILFAASVLWLQGLQKTVQPLKDDDALLVYNGDIFGGFDDVLRQDVGDTTLFFESLQMSDNVVETVSRLEGPYAFVYLKNHKLYFGRDPYGRRSLLVGKKDNQIVVTSVARKNTGFNFMELPCTGVFSIDLNTRRWQVFPWSTQNKNFKSKIQELESLLKETVIMEELNFGEVRSFQSPNQDQMLVINDILKSTNVLDYFCNIYLERITKLRDLLAGSVKKRILTQPKFCRDCFGRYECPHVITGVLFSGGVDCAILAHLADNFIEESRPIDLINVAFEKNESFDTPDRITARETLKELQSLCPQRNWNFVEVNISREELDSCRKERISDLIYPLSSILDDSLGCALWFASRAATTTYTSPCRTLLVGMGADELFGGYTRHRAACQKHHWQGLHEVLEEDWQNLPHRNLARDDRVVSDHGRQLRTPYLDEKVVEFVRNLPCWDRTLPVKELPQGIGEKILLRSLAYHLGLKNAATFKKRALQFGSRIANSKEKGHETAERLQE